MHSQRKKGLVVGDMGQGIINDFLCPQQSSSLSTVQRILAGYGGCHKLWQKRNQGQRIGHTMHQKCLSPHLSFSPSSSTMLAMADHEHTDVGCPDHYQIGRAHV